MAKITMQEARRFLWAFPLVAGTAWLGMLLTLLTYWVASGRPRLPLQSNPYIAYVVSRSESLNWERKIRPQKRLLRLMIWALNNVL